VPDVEGEGRTDPTADALQQRIAAAALDIANTEEHLAATFDHIARRVPAGAEDLNAVAAHAREHAQSEREVASRVSDEDKSTD
jgi:hypothetical protein